MSQHTPSAERPPPLSPPFSGNESRRESSLLSVVIPALERSWIQAHHLWRARWSQPVVTKHYSKLIPAEDGPVEGLHVCSMAQIYPEDRGTNYAIREGRRIGKRLAGIIEARD